MPPLISMIFKDRVRIGIMYFVFPVCPRHDLWVFSLNNAVNGVPHKYSNSYDCVYKQVTSLLCCIKVSSLLAPQEKQRAGGSLGRSALPWATYQTAGMCAVGVSVCLQRADMQQEEWVVVKTECSMHVYGYKYSNSIKHTYKHKTVKMKAS